jgi:hypothetical protein
VEDAAPLVQPHLADTEARRVVLHERRPRQRAEAAALPPAGAGFSVGAIGGCCSFARVHRNNLPALGYLYVALGVPALVLGPRHERAASALLTAAAFAYLWFLGSLMAQLVRFEPDGFFASVVGLGGAAYLAVQGIAVLSSLTQLAALSSAAAATVIIGSSLAAWRARKIRRWFGQAGVAGGIAVLVVGMVEGASNWTFMGHSVFASSLGFMIWVVVTATYLLRRATLRIR